mmetsp:Transcript_101795/g.294572  ORF Transcript_101795/g.294572 Transcript_101795/m.294572 type:complete len:222 (-) Transcript_101795:510-1175(-)
MWPKITCDIEKTLTASMHAKSLWSLGLNRMSDLPFRTSDQWLTKPSSSPGGRGSGTQCCRNGAEGSVLPGQNGPPGAGASLTIDMECSRRCRLASRRSSATVPRQTRRPSKRQTANEMAAPRVNSALFVNSTGTPPQPKKLCVKALVPVALPTGRTKSHCTLTFRAPARRPKLPTKEDSSDSVQTLGTQLPITNLDRKAAMKPDRTQYCAVGISAQCAGSP